MTVTLVNLLIEDAELGTYTSVSLIVFGEEQRLFRASYLGTSSVGEPIRSQGLPTEADLSTYPHPLFWRKTTCSFFTRA